MPRSVMDIFLSSTSKDLADCRAKVRVMVDRMRQISIAMETFGARPATPLKTCRVQVEKSDALIVIVGHRYGWVPSRQDGGDGDRSITWWEVHWALEAGNPVFAFLLDPTTPWTGEREQDRLLEATSNEEILAAGRAVKGLQEFRRYLERKTSRELFANADDLAAKVATSLHPWLLEHALKATGGRVSADAVERGPIGRGTTRSESADLTPLQYCYEQIHLLSALSFVNRASTKPVRLGLIAGRADASHPALSGARIQQITMLGRKDAQKADDYTTAVAGLLVGGDAGSGYQGVAQGTELLVLGVLEEDQSVRSEALLRAIDAACIEGVNVLCLPLGGLASSKTEHLLLKRAVTAGITVVCPAGNEASPEPQYPAAFPEVLAVGAVTPLE